MKKFILLTLFVPFLGFAQNPKADKVANDINTAATVIGNMVDLFKKSKNETPKANDKDKKSGNASSNGSTFSINAEPEDILPKIMKCTWKKFYDEKYCFWKSEPKDFSKIETTYDESGQMFATKVDTVMSFKQNGISNIVLRISSYPTDGDGVYVDCTACSVYLGLIRLQSTDGQQMKLTNLDKILVPSGGAGKQIVNVLNLEDDNIFYEIKESWAIKEYRDFSTQYFDLNGNLIVRFDAEEGIGGYATEYKTEIDRTGKSFKLVHYDEYYNSKGKLIKSPGKTVATYQYGNGTITEIKKPAKAGGKKKKK